MAVGIPTVVSPVGMATELVENNVNGFWARTPEEWFETLSQLVTDARLRIRFSEAGRKTIESRYSLQAWAPRMTELLQQVLEERHTVMAARAVSASN